MIANDNTSGSPSEDAPRYALRPRPQPRPRPGRIRLRANDNVPGRHGRSVRPEARAALDCLDEVRKPGNRRAPRTPVGGLLKAVSMIAHGVGSAAQTLAGVVAASVGEAVRVIGRGARVGRGDGAGADRAREVEGSHGSAVRQEDGGADTRARP